jgi:ribonuclease HII
MLLIATDEAGYGPKLGPLVIAATAWELPDSIEPDRVESLFEPLRTPQPCGEWTCAIDDSKAVYKAGQGLQRLHAIVSASHHWCGRRGSTFAELLPHLAGEDLQSIGAAPWLCQVSDERLLDPEQTQDVRDSWSRSGVRQVDTLARVITAERFNEACRSANKAELLSESTLQLVKSLLQTHQGKHREFIVYCDRHGGRRYYAGVLQHVFFDAVVQVIAENQQQSSYRMILRKNPNLSQTITIHFTVKGDSFTPVAMSSLHAKYIRERFMESFNRFFAQLYRGSEPLKPTAGYPVDADRFLFQVAEDLKREKILADQLVRSR